MPLVDITFVRGKLSAAFSLLRNYIHRVPRLGLLAATILFFAEASTRHPLMPLVKPFAPERLKLTPRGYGHPISFRRAGTDVAVLRQVLLDDEYLPVAGLRDVRLIVDCGANIGLSAYYLLHHYPAARLIAVEPDPENCALCRHNLAPFSDRTTILQGAIWSENRRLRIVPSSRGLGSWALRVEGWDGGEVEGLTLVEILRRSGHHGPIDLLKMDIEGAEEEVFRDAPRWLDVTRNIAIELHGAAAEACLSRALASYSYEWRRAHELTLVLDLRHVPGSMPTRGVWPTA